MTIVVVGFFLTVHLLITQASDGTPYRIRQAATLVLALGFAVRYWWVILLLPWPPRWIRTILLLAAWSALPVVATMTANPIRWAFALAALSAIGCMTEVYNGLTKQWLVGAERMARTLRTDHVFGAASAGGATIGLLLIAFFRSPWVDFLVPLMVFADWIRLILMIRRHQRLIDLGYLT